MDIELRDKFLTLWKKYFNNAELPITFYFSDDGTRALPAGKEHFAPVRDWGVSRGQGRKIPVL